MINDSVLFEEKAVTVVLVDDEEMVLSSLQSFLELETEYCIKTFTTPKAALEFAESNSADVVLSDFLMPKMNGIDFLRKFGEIQPHAPRILLTGYADKDSAIRAINDVGLFQYIEKPWDNSALLIVLRNAIERRFLAKALQEKIAEIDLTQGQLSGLQTRILKTFI